MSIQPKNLEQKVALLLEDIERASDSEKIRRVTRFVEEQMEWKNADHLFDDHDIAVIKSMATKNMTDFSLNRMQAMGWTTGYGSDNDAMRTVCWIEGVIGYLRSKSLIPFTISFSTKKGRR